MQAKCPIRVRRQDGGVAAVWWPTMILRVVQIYRVTFTPENMDQACTVSRQQHEDWPFQLHRNRGKRSQRQRNRNRRSGGVKILRNQMIYAICVCHGHTKTKIEIEKEEEFRLSCDTRVDSMRCRDHKSTNTDGKVNSPGTSEGNYIDCVHQAFSVFSSTRVTTSSVSTLMVLAWANLR